MRLVLTLVLAMSLGASSRLAAKEPAQEQSDVTLMVGPPRAPAGITLSETLKTVRIGGRVDQLLLPAPLKLVDGLRITHPDYDKDEGDPIQLTLAEDGQTIARIDLIFRGFAAEGALARRWGPSRRVHNSIGRFQSTWFDQGRGLRAVATPVGLKINPDEMLQQTWIRIEPCLSFDQWVGPAAGRFGFEKIPLLGASPAAIVKAFGLPAFGDEVSLIVLPLPCTEIVADEPMQAMLHVRDDRVWAVDLSIDAQSDRRELPALLARLRAKLGRARTAPHPWRDRRKGRTHAEAFDGPPRAQLAQHGQAMELTLFAPDEDPGSATPP